MFRTLFLSLAIVVSGCVHAPVDTPIGCPSGPDIIAIDQELWRTIPLHVRSILLHNTTQWENWYDDACGRIKRHDEALAR